MNSHTPAWEAKPCECGQKSCGGWRLDGPTIRWDLWEKKDARLAAAAPDLYAAATLAIAAIAEAQDHDDAAFSEGLAAALESLRAAAYKAEGR